MSEDTIISGKGFNNLCDFTFCTRYDNHFGEQIHIGNSETQTKTIVLDKMYPSNTEIMFIHDHKDTFSYVLNGKELTVTRTDENYGWGQNLIGYIYKNIETGRFIEILNNNNNLNNYLKYIVSPITPYLICKHHFSTELYKGNHKYIGEDIKELLNENTNDLYLNKNFDKIKEGDIIQVQVDLFSKFVNNILPQISCKIIVITSQWHLPQINRNQITDEFINNDKLILWISQNPIYENHNKYMAFPYGICHKDVNNYINFIKKNYNKILNIDTKTNLCFNSPVSLHDHLPTNHIRRHPIFNSVKNKRLSYDEYLNSILKSKFTISTSGDRDDCYRHYECIGLNSIPISDINYREIFGNNMIYSDIDNIIEMINETKIIGYNESNNYINPDILLIDYWRYKISKRTKGQIFTSS